MKKKLLLSFFFVACCFAHLFAQSSWLWAKSASGTGADEGCSVAADVSGNVYITGFFSSPTVTFGTYTLTNSGSASTGDVFLAKYDSLGNILWAKSAQGTGPDICYSVATDVSGNAYVMGYFYSPILTFGTYTLTNTGGSNIFLAKYDASGTVLWAKSSVGTGGCEGRCVATDIFGNVYITGDFGTPSITFGTYTLTNSGTLSVFIAKYDSFGDALWAKTANGTTYDWGNSIAADAFGNIYMTGRFDSPSLIFGAYTIINAGTENTFLAKYDSSGNILWAKSVGIGSDNMGNGVATDASSNIYVTGGFLSSLTIGTYTFTSGGNYDVYLAKYDEKGNVLWANNGTGIGSDFGYSVATDISGNVYTAGRFSYSSINSITFGSITLPFPSGGTDPMFIVKYDSSGNVLCASALASGGDDNNGVATDALGDVYIGGDFECNPFIVGTDTLLLGASSGAENIFVAKYKSTCSNPEGMNELRNEESISVYPNPFSENAVIRITNLNELQIKTTEIKIYDVMGQEVHPSVIRNSDSFVISRSRLSAGVYFLQLKSSDKTYRAKIIIE